MGSQSTSLVLSVLRLASAADNVESVDTYLARLLASEKGLMAAAFEVGMYDRLVSRVPLPISSLLQRMQ